VLVEQGADVNATSFKYGTPLCVAAFRGHLHIVDALLGNYHASMDANGGWLGSPLHAACLRQSEVDGHVQSRLLRRLVKQRGTLSSSKKVNLGFCVHHREHLCAPDAIQCYLEGHPIHIAAYFGQKDAVDCLLALGDDIDSLAHLSEPKDSGNTETQDLTSLMLASMQYSNLETLATLLKKGASTELQDNNGFTALLYAASHISTQSSQRVVALINSGCDVNAMSHEGFTALTVAAQNGHNDCFSILRDAGANILSVDKRSWTAVKHAYSSGHLPALVQSTVQAMLFVSSRWFAVGLGWALKRLADACQQMHVAATYFDTAREANADNDSSGSGTNICLNHLIQLTEKCNAFLQHMALRTKQDSKPLFAVNDVVLSCSVLGFAPCLVPILILKWESDKTTLPWSIAAFSIFNKIRSLLSEIQEFLKEFESTTMEEKTPTVLDDPG
jgi:ankyrin repeat protein